MKREESGKKRMKVFRKGCAENRKKGAPAGGSYIPWGRNVYLSQRGGKDIDRELSKKVRRGGKWNAK